MQSLLEHGAHTSLRIDESPADKVRVRDVDAIHDRSHRLVYPRVGLDLDAELQLLARFSMVADVDTGLAERGGQRGGAGAVTERGAHHRLLAAGYQGTA